MRLILFRHGPAGERDPKRWPDDRQRPLTAKGEERTRRAGRGIRRLEGDIHVVLASPLVRCARTADLLREVCGPKSKPESLAALAPGGSWREVLERLGQEAADTTVVLVGHEPELGKIAGVLLFGAPRALPIKKAGACSLEFEDVVAAGAGRLRWFLPPRVLARLATSRSRV